MGELSLASRDPLWGSRLARDSLGAIFWRIGDEAWGCEGVGGRAGGVEAVVDCRRTAGTERVICARGPGWGESWDAGAPRSRARDGGAVGGAVEDGIQIWCCKYIRASVH